MKPDMPAVLRLGFFQVIVSYARTIRQYRKAAGMPSGWPPELTLLLSSVHLSAQQRLYDPALTGPEALRLVRIVYSLAQSVLTTLPPLEKTKKPAPNPFVRSRTPPVLPRLPVEHLPVDMTAMLDSAIGEALRTAAQGQAVERKSP
jgi:hypothetical protein